MPMHKQDLGESRVFLRRLADIINPLAAAGPVPRGPPQRAVTENPSGETDQERVVNDEGSRLPPERYADAGREAREIVEEMLQEGYDDLPRSDPRRLVLEVGTILSQLSDSLESVDRVVELATRMGRQLRK